MCGVLLCNGVYLNHFNVFNSEIGSYLGRYYVKAEVA